MGQLSPATIHNYSYMVGKFIDFCSRNGVSTPPQITQLVVCLFIQELQMTNSAQSVLDYFKQVRRFINWLRENDQISIDPLKNIRLPKVPRRIIQPFNKEQCQTLLDLVSLPTLEARRNKAILMVFMDTGIRCQELADMKLEDLNFETETIKIFGKGAKERVVRIGPKVQRALLEYQYLKIQSFPGDKTPDVWVSRCKTRYNNADCHPLTTNGIMQTIVTLGKRAGITNIRCSPHTFRHTFATMCLRNGAGEFEVQSLMGHSTLTMTRRYASSLNSEAAVQGHKKFSPVDNLKL
nr:tyrosine-type recombinase/integrase [Dehalococcoides mccartyi]